MTTFMRRSQIAACALLLLTVAFESSCSRVDERGGEVTASSSPPPLEVATSAPIQVGTPNRHLAVGLRTIRYSGDAGMVEVRDFQVKPSSANVRVVDVLGGLGRDADGYQNYSLSEVITDLEPTLAVSGASATSLSVPIPLGLVVDDGHTASQLDKRSYFATGVFCVKADGVPVIMYREHYRAGNCLQAMQSGPIIVDPGGTLGENRNERLGTPHEYLVVAIGHDGTLHVVYATSTHLYDLASHLISDLGIVSAINLGAGSEHTALFANAPGVRLTLGNLDGAIPSAIVVSAR